MNPYQPPMPGVAPPPGLAPGVEGPSQNRCIVLLVLSVVSFICGCGIFAVIPIGLSIVALVKRESDPKLALLMNRITIGCLIAGFVLLLISVGVNVWFAVANP